MPSDVAATQRAAKMGRPFPKYTGFIVRRASMTRLIQADKTGVNMFWIESGHLAIIKLCELFK